jgi:hypothetical protein
MFAGALAFQDVLIGPEIQKKKSYFYVRDKLQRPIDEIINRTFLPGSHEIQAHTAEVLRQVRGARVQPGGRPGGDAWFGSAMKSVDVVKQL